MLTIFLQQDLRFPILEGFAFVFVLSAFFFGVMNQSQSSAQIASQYASIVMEISLLIFMVLIWRNVSSGIGAELEKGQMQTYLTYPLSRGRLYFARLLSSVGVPLMVFAASQILALVIVAPAFLVREGGTFWLVYLAAFGTPLFITAFILLMAQASKQGGLSLVAGVFSYFFLGLFLPVFVSLAESYHNAVAVGMLSVLNPLSPVLNHFNGDNCLGFGCVPPPTLLLAQEYVIANYIVSACFFTAGYFWFRKVVEA